MDILDNTLPAVTSTWPPEYILRVSKRAKHVHLKVLPQRGLEIVVPIRQRNRVKINDLLSEKRDWIEKHLATIKIVPKEYITRLELRAINQSWNIVYQATLSKQIRHVICMGTESNTLTLYGAIENIDITHTWLQKWLKQIAKKYLLPWLQDLSIKHQLPFKDSSVRGQQTMWGSCTSAKNISLNYKLLFLPRNYTEHIMLHELCHTKHLNHSKNFWYLLLSLDANTKNNNRAIRESDNFIPSWLI